MRGGVVALRGEEKRENNESETDCETHIQQKKKYSC